MPEAGHRDRGLSRHDSVTRTSITIVGASLAVDLLDGAGRPLGLEPALAGRPLAPEALRNEVLAAEEEKQA